MSQRTAAFAFAARVLRIAVALIPWALSLYLHYRFEVLRLWDASEPWRAPLSVLIIATGMALSFALHGWLARRAR